MTKEIEVYTLICYGKESENTNFDYGFCVNDGKRLLKTLIWFKKEYIKIPNYPYKFLKDDPEHSYYRICKIKILRKVLVEFMFNKNVDIYPNDHPIIIDTYHNNWIKELSLEDVR